MEAILKVEGVCKYFGGLKAVEKVDFEVKESQIFALIGPNGAGKTTLFNAITCFIPATNGKIVYKGHSIEKETPHEITKLGLTRTWQNVRVFPNFTVLENVMAGRVCRTKSGIFSSIINSKLSKAEEKETLRISEETLDFMGLHDLKDHLAKNLAYGNQKRLEIARALATEPKMLLLDEPAAGLNNSETMQLMELIFKIREKGITILLIEHDMKMVMQVSDRIVVLDHGQKIAQGTPDEIKKNDKVIVSYLGEGADNNYGNS